MKNRKFIPIAKFHALAYTNNLERDGRAEELLIASQLAQGIHKTYEEYRDACMTLKVPAAKRDMWDYYTNLKELQDA